MSVIGVSLLKSYEDLCRDKNYEKNPHQIKVVHQLEHFASRLVEVNHILHSPSFFKTLFSGVANLLTASNDKKADIDTLPQGLYIYGGVGRGKSMMMDLFFENIQFSKKLRIHFMDFMRNTHNLLKDFRKKNVNNALLSTADSIADKYQLICFDEFQVLDITDAMLLGRLFNALMERNVRFVITSNRHPDELYLNGLNRQLFLPFIDTLKKKFNIIHLSHDKDYRQKRLLDQRRYLYPLSQETDDEFSNIWELYHEDQQIKPMIIHVSGRELCFPKSFDCVMQTNFSELCDKTLGNNDFLELAKNVRILLLDNIPIMTSDMRNQATRFRGLIDAFYEAKNLIYFRASASPENLYQAGDYHFEFQRTLSRIQEMQAKNYATHLSPQT